ncbi:MAG TPA: DUF6069 family protein [Longimicrobiaceae bacterium]|nr:DUF6069 family protein [Longimicrobiaceae bacterium]
MSAYARVQPARPAWSVWRAGVVAAGVAAAVNVAVFLTAAALDVFPAARLLPRTPDELAVGPVALMSALGALGGAAAFALLRSRSDEPLRTFLQAAALVLVVSLGAPLMVPEFTAAQAAVLVLMHVVVAVCTVVVLWRWAHPVEH